MFFNLDKIPRLIVLSVILCIGCLGDSSVLYAASGGETGAEFLKLNPDPEATSMGEGNFGVISDIPAGSFNNPASLVGVIRPKLSLQYMMLPESMVYNYGSLAVPFGKGAVGSTEATRLQSSITPVSPASSGSDDLITLFQSITYWYRSLRRLSTSTPASIQSPTVRP